MPALISRAAPNAAILFSGTPGPWSPRCANPIGPGSSGSASDLDDRIHLDRDAERKHGHADSGTGVASRFAEHFLHQLRSAVGDLRLVGKIAVAVYENTELDDPLDPVE